MQRSYLYCVPKRKTDSRRVVLNFRQGDKREVTLDTGTPVLTDKDNQSIWSIPPKPKTTIFGFLAFQHVLEEGSAYSRHYLWKTFSHR